MYRVMIIDDERAIRNILRKTVRWDGFDMEVAGEAESGIEAINTIDDLQPQVALVDIRMPYMNGIEFAALAKERYPALKIIILTAFDEFGYARDCIGVGVSAYILKPINRDEIEAALANIRKELDAAGPPEEPVSCKPESVSGRVRGYIGEHYQDKDLNLTKIALVFGYNPSYLSRLIRQETGCTLTELLMEKRMEKAKQYAAGGMAMYLAGREVGIPDPQYFGKCFKKYVGSNYSDLKKS